MSYRTNRKTGGVFRTRDYTPSEIESQARRFICPRCEAMLGHDVPPAVAAQYSRETGHEVPGTPISSLTSRAELNEHIRMMHPGQRLPTRTHRRLGRGQVSINITQTNTPTETKETITETEPETVTETEPETATETETETEGEGGIGGESFTDDDEQVFQESPDSEGGSLL